MTLQLVVEYYLSGDTLARLSEEAKSDIYKYFGSFLRATLTMFEVTFGNWYTPCRVLVETCSEWFMIFFLVHVVVIGFSSIAVINGVFINETFKVSEQDDKYMLMRQAQDNKMFSNKMKRLFEAADVGRSGAITPEQFAEVLSHSEIRDWLSAMQIDFDDTHELFKLIDDNGDGDTTVEELVDGVAKLKGDAKAYDLAVLRRHVLRMEREISERLTVLCCQMQSPTVNRTQQDATALCQQIQESSAHQTALAEQVPSAHQTARSECFALGQVVAAALSAQDVGIDFNHIKRTYTN
jgi:hypothetical protein